MRYSIKYIDGLFNTDNPTESVTGILDIASTNPSLDVRFLDGVGHPLFNLLMYQNYSGDVGNGGHAQYFWNSYGDQCLETVSALREIGLPEFSAILERSFEVFDDGKPPKDRTIRMGIVESLQDLELALLGRCDRALYQVYNEKAEKKAQTYLIANRSGIFPLLCFE